jgi:hypothetical protein
VYAAVAKVKTNLIVTEVIRNVDMYTANEVIKDKYWIVNTKHGKVGTLRRVDESKYEFFNLKANTREILNDLNELFTLQTKDTSDNKAQSYITKLSVRFPCNFPAPIEYENDGILPLYKKTANGKSVFAAGYYIIQFKNWLPSYCPKLDTLEKYEYRGPYPTEWEMNLDLKRYKR